jgi:hypothetical protein
LNFEVACEASNSKEEWRMARDNMGNLTKVALITTTIYVPEVLEIYRDIGKDVTFFVTGDRKTPHDQVRKFVEGLGNAIYYSDSDQEKLGYKCSPLIGWNKIMRRNIALLEAIKYKPDLIVTIDDDNFPLDKDYFDHFVRVLGRSFTGLRIRTDEPFFNVGQFLSPTCYHRGFPHDSRHKQPQYEIIPAHDIKIGVAEGVCIGDPDIDAVDRVSQRPQVHHISEVLRQGIAVTAPTMAPINSQNTAYVSELAPLFMVWVGVGRYDDIWASYTAQRIMKTLGYGLHYGPPFAWQQRNPHNLWQNLRDEILGMECTPTFCEDLNRTDIGTGTVLEKLERLYEELKNKQYLPELVYRVGKAWCEDVAGLL